MEEWGVIGLFILLFAPTAGRFSTIVGILTIIVGIGVIVLAGGDSIGALGVAGLVSLAAAFAHNKITGELELVDIFSGIAGVALIVIGIICA